MILIYEGNNNNIQDKLKQNFYFRRRNTYGHIPEHVRKSSGRKSRSGEVQPQRDYKERQRKRSVTPYTPRKQSHGIRSRKRSSVRSYRRQQEMEPNTINEDDEVEENEEQKATEFLDENQDGIEKVFHQNEAFVDDNDDHVFLETEATVCNAHEQEKDDYKESDDSKNTFDEIFPEFLEKNIWDNEGYEEPVTLLNDVKYDIKKENIADEDESNFENFHLEKEYLPRTKGRSMSEWNLRESVEQAQRRFSSPEKPDQRELEFDISQSILPILSDDRYLADKNLDEELRNYLSCLDSSPSEESCSCSHSGSHSYTPSGSGSESIDHSLSNSRPRSASEKDSQVCVSQESSSSSSSDFRKESRPASRSSSRRISRSASRASSLRENSNDVPPTPR